MIKIEFMIYCLLCDTIFMNYIILHNKDIMFYQTECVKINNVRSETRYLTNISSMYNPSDNFKGKDIHISYNVCIINDGIEIIEPLNFGHSWYDEFTRHMNKEVILYKFSIGSVSNTLYAYEIDGKKTYMNDQIMNALIIPSMMIGSCCIMTYILANHIFKK